MTYRIVCSRSNTNYRNLSFEKAFDLYFTLQNNFLEQLSIAKNETTIENILKSIGSLKIEKENE